ncbi:hypothetical protein ACFL2B_03040 [Patescibacteria group bacterium]
MTNIVKIKTRTSLKQLWRSSLSIDDFIQSVEREPEAAACTCELICFQFTKKLKITSQVIRIGQLLPVRKKYILFRPSPELESIVLPGNTLPLHLSNYVGLLRKSGRKNAVYQVMPLAKHEPMLSIIPAQPPLAIQNPMVVNLTNVNIHIAISKKRWRLIEAFLDIWL